MNLVLASGSPRRADLLTRLGLVFEVVPPDIDEAARPNESPTALVERLAREKAAAVGSAADVVVAADTLVLKDGRALGKPGHPEEARRMLQQLSGATHEVLTGVAVAHQGRLVSSVDVSSVTMMEMTSLEISEYVAGGEPMDKAGAYALQGRGGLFVERVSGSPFTVIGLPIHLLPRLFAGVGADIDAFSVSPPA